MILSPRSLRNAAANTAHKLVRGQIADLRPMPAETVGGRSVRRYRPPESVIPTGPPVLLVPPPGPAGALAFDLRRGCSLAEHLVGLGRRVYLLDHGRTDDRETELERWVEEMLPEAVRRVGQDAGGQPVQLVGWSLGGIFSLLAAAAAADLPIASIAAIASPVGFTAPRPGRGGIPHLLVERGIQMIGFDRRVARHYNVLTNIDNADHLAQIEAVDHFTAATDGRGAAQILQDFFHGNELAKGSVVVAGRPVELKDVKVPVLVIAGRGDGLAPWKAVHPLTRLLTGSPEVRFDTAPGDHLGVLTGRAARAGTWARLDRWLDAGALRHGLRAPRQPREATATR